MTMSNHKCPICGEDMIQKKNLSWYCKKGEVVKNIIKKQVSNEKNKGE